MKQILCFGDSNTYGYIPDGSGRFDVHTRWTGRLQKILGNEYHIIEEGFCGRTTVFQDELQPERHGIDAISIILESHVSLDYVVIMLGTNDCKTIYGASAGMIAKGMEKIIEKVEQYTRPKTGILMISPIHLGKGIGEDGYDKEFDTKSELVSRRLAGEYQKMAQIHHCAFLDAATIASPSETDREHMDKESHAALATAIALKVTESC